MHFHKLMIFFHTLIPRSFKLRNAQKNNYPEDDRKLPAFDYLS